MRFPDETPGGISEPVPGLTIEKVLGRLKHEDAADERAPIFAKAVLSIAQTWRDMVGDDDTTTAEKRDLINKVAHSAATMRQALQALAEGGGNEEAFRCMAADHVYLAFRARERSAGAPGRHEVPPLPYDMPRELTDLLARLATDLQTLRTVADYTAEKLKPVRNAQKLEAQAVARDLAEAYRAVFGEKPPGRGWFGNHLAPLVGEALGITIGWNVTEKAVKAMD